jgi:hypothetical protein
MLLLDGVEAPKEISVMRARQAVKRLVLGLRSWWNSIRTPWIRAAIYALLVLRGWQIMGERTEGAAYLTDSTFLTLWAELGIGAAWAGYHEPVSVRGQKTEEE